MKWFEDPIQDKKYAKKMHIALAITLAGNLILATGKWLAAAHSGSSALLADAWNSISDVLYSLTLIIGLLIAIRPADFSHPHGHERFEPFVGLFISCSMFLAGIEALSSAIKKLKGYAVPVEPLIPIIILLFSAGIKCLMFYSIRKIANDISSKSLANAAQDNLLDVLTSAAAAAGILTSKYIHPIADPIAGILLSIWIFKNAVQVFVENLNYLTGHGADRQDLEKYLKEIESVPGVCGVHQLYGEYVGTKLRLDIHIDVDGNAPLHVIHDIETEIENRMAQHGEIDHVFIHAEPWEAQKKPKE